MELHRQSQHATRWLAYSNATSERQGSGREGASSTVTATVPTAVIRTNRIYAELATRRRPYENPSRLRSTSLRFGNDVDRFSDFDCFVLCLPRRGELKPNGSRSNLSGLGPRKSPELQEMEQQRAGRRTCSRISNGPKQCRNSVRRNCARSIQEPEWR